MTTARLTERQAEASQRARSSIHHTVLAERLQALLHERAAWATRSILSITVRMIHLDHLTDIGVLEYSKGPTWEIWRFNDRTAAWVEAILAKVSA